MSNRPFQLAVTEYAETVASTRRFASQAGAHPEAQLAEPTRALIRAAGDSCNLAIDVVEEVREAELRARPDLGIFVDGLLCGHIELKAPGKGSDPRRFRDVHDREQWDRMSALPNLLYTDGLEWTLCRSGDVVAGPIHPEHRSDLLQETLRDFLYWQPSVPHQPRELAAFLAPLCRLIRDEAAGALARPDSAVRQLADEWRRSLFAEADDNRFADAYAQTLTYALLLARLEGALVDSLARAAESLDPDNGVLAQALRILGPEAARREVRLGVDLLQRALHALDPSEFHVTGPEPWLYFYEDFLAAYDPRLRRNMGVYYTPVEVVHCQIRLVAQLLAERFDRPLAFADEGVTVLDPAAGTGTYLLHCIEHSLHRVREREGPGAVPQRASLVAANAYGFELLIGPYAVAHLRLSRAIRDAGGEAPGGRPQLYLADTLQSPWIEAPDALSLQHRPLVEERRRAVRVKANTRILVCLGNPPYDRQQIDAEDADRRKGGWVRFGHDDPDLPPAQSRPPLEDFLEPARAVGAGLHLKNLYNDYVYFWRWALWKLFDQRPHGGIVSFITASSYLRGPGFVGMRELMRRAFDDLWIIDLGGDGLGTRRSENVFDIRTPVAIAVGFRAGAGDPNVPARVRYTRVDGTRRGKLETLEQVVCFGDLDWEDCPSEWGVRFTPHDAGDYFAWPALINLFPWQHSGVQFKRTWPIGETEDVLHERWSYLVGIEDLEQRRRAFHESGDRKIDEIYTSTESVRAPRIVDLDSEAPPPPAHPYAYRAFDCRHAFLDVRLASRRRPELLATTGDRQIFLTSLLTQPLGSGPAAVVTDHIPDLHHFRGSFGGKDVVPLYRDDRGIVANVTLSLLDVLEEAWTESVSPEALFAYAYAVLAAPSYTTRFADKLETPGPRVPIPRDGELFRGMATLGRRLVWLHTKGRRMSPDGDDSGGLPPGEARCTAAVPQTEANYPDEVRYLASAREIALGAGRFGPVAPEIWNYEVSGYKVVERWIKARLRSGTGRRSSPLDDVRPRAWDHRLTHALLELLWTVEHTLVLGPDLDELLEAVVAGECFEAMELPMPGPDERRPPPPQRSSESPVFDDPITPTSICEGGWYSASCPEVPSALGRGRTAEEAQRDLLTAVDLVREKQRLRTLGR